MGYLCQIVSSPFSPAEACVGGALPVHQGLGIPTTLALFLRLGSWVGRGTSWRLDGVWFVSFLWGLHTAGNMRKSEHPSLEKLVPLHAWVGVSKFWVSPGSQGLA